MSITDPHCRQNMSSMLNPPFHRTLTQDCGALPYHRRTDEFKSVIHWGQRKLLMSEIEFLTMCQEDHSTHAVHTTVVYAGAAPGTHIPALGQLFPAVNFVLVDPAPFSIKPSDGITIIQDLFTDELAQGLAESLKPAEQILFISDIRTADPTMHTLDESEERIRKDMDNQRRWHKILGSVRSMLKFRLPWDKGHSEYLDGSLHLPVWGPQTTTECRLVTVKDDPCRTKVYDHERYESQMFFFNMVARTALYTHSVRALGMDRCYDCRAEVEILKNYVLRASPWDAPEPAKLDQDLAKMSEWISRVISKNRTLAHGNPDKVQRINAIKRRQYPGGVPAYEKKQK